MLEAAGPLDLIMVEADKRVEVAVGGHVFRGDERSFNTPHSEAVEWLHRASYLAKDPRRDTFWFTEAGKRLLHCFEAKREENKKGAVEHLSKVVGAR